MQEPELEPESELGLEPEPGLEPVQEPELEPESGLEPEPEQEPQLEPKREPEGTLDQEEIKTEETDATKEYESFEDENSIPEESQLISEKENNIESALNEDQDLERSKTITLAIKKKEEPEEKIKPDGLESLNLDDESESIDELFTSEKETLDEIKLRPKLKLQFKNAK